MSGKNLVKLASVLLLALWFSCGGVKAQPMPPMPPNPWDNQIGNWSFEDTNWYSDYGYTPVSFTNLDNPAGFDGNVLQVDSTNAAWLQYNIIEDDGFENLTFDQGTIELWVLPNWNSTTNGGVGLGDWGRLIDVGAYGTNAPSSWWSLYFTPDGNNLCFSSETNGVFTNYLSCPISWDSNTWHLVSLTYDQSQSQLYIDGQLATNGAGVQYLPSAGVVSNGFFVGSDHTGMQQAHAQIDDLSTYNYVIWSAEITNDYAAGMNLISPPDSGGLMSGGFGGGGFGMDDSSGSSTDGITNLWIAQLALTSGYLTAIASNTLADVQYEIQSLTDLTQTNWQSQGFIVGSETTNWTALNPLPVSRTNNFFIRLKSWASSDGSGLPDWWQLQNFGYVGVDPYGNPAGDGYSNLYKFQNGMNPNAFYTPAAPQGVKVNYNANNGTANISWLPSAGNVTNYTVERTYLPFYYSTPQVTDFTTNSTVYVDNVAIEQPDPWSDGAILTTYTVRANYAAGNSTVSAAVPLEAPSFAGRIIAGSQGATDLAVQTMPANTTSILLTEINGDAVNSGIGTVFVTNLTVLINILSNSIAAIPNVGTPDDDNYYWVGQAIGADGSLSAPAFLATDFNDFISSSNNNFITPPFYDGRVQMKQNLIFKLRAAQLDRPFSFYFYGYDQYPGMDYAYDDYATAPSNYVYSGFLHVANPGDYAYMHNGTLFDAMFPFKENYFDRNFVFDTSYIDSTTGAINTGVNDDGDYTDLEPYLATNAVFQFQVPTTNWTTLPGLNPTNTTRWLSSIAPDVSYEFYTECGLYWTNYSPYVPTFSLGNSVYNLFGLQFLSMKFTCQNGSSYAQTTLSKNSTSTVGSGTKVYVCEETAQPQLQAVEYDFWNANPVYDSSLGQWTANALPGNPNFSLTNSSQSFMVSVGSSIQIAGYAKLAVQNGYSGVYGYLGQYFDKAYKIDMNGSATTNTTGILSPYGIFTATEPGQANLVTMPDLDTDARGTCAVYCVSMNVDANHDGTMDASFSGADATSQATPDVVWVNNGHTQPGSNGGLDKDLAVPPASTNYNIGRITCQRELENFFRLWICGVPSLPSSNDYSATLTCAAITGSPAINVYEAETNGGTLYLTDPNTAQSLVNETELGTAGTTTTGSGTLIFPDNFFDGSTKHLLFEGSGVGEGQFILTIYQGTNAIAQTSTFIDLHDVEDLYEQARATNVTSGLPPSSLVSQYAIIHPSSGTPNETKEVIVHVHGMNDSETQWKVERDTIFKRLYWSGYHGRFASFKWPCAFLPFENSINPFNYNLSEFFAWKSATAFNNYLCNLTNRSDLTGYSINILAHSQGNIVASEAIKQGAPFDNYILTQAASPAHAYDTNAPFLTQLLTAEADTHTPFYTTNGGYNGYFTNLNAHGRLVDFFNTNDFALASGTYTIPLTGITLQANWVADQASQKPEDFSWRFGQYYTYSSSGGGSEAYYDISQYAVTDPYEIMSMVARSRSAAVGAQGGLGGAIGSSVDLGSSFQFGATRDEHSAQIFRPIQTSLSYYRQILLEINPP
jgi:hypothetical protein